MHLGHVSLPDGRALLSHLAVDEQTAPGACEALTCHLDVLWCRGSGSGSSQQTSCHGEMAAV